MEQHIRVQVEDHAPLAILHLEGSLAQLEVYKFKAQIEKLMLGGIRYLIFDLEKLGFIDSAGIGALVQVRGELQKTGGALVLAAPTSPHVRSALTTSQLGRVIPTFATVAEAHKDLAERFALRDAAETKSRASENSQILQLLQELLTRVKSIDERLAQLERRPGGF